MCMHMNVILYMYISIMYNGTHYIATYPQIIHATEGDHLITSKSMRVSDMCSKSTYNVQHVIHIAHMQLQMEECSPENQC